MDSLYNQKVINANSVFDTEYLDAKALYLNCFNRIPSLNYIGRIDGEKAYNAFREQFSNKIVSTYQYRWYKLKDKKYQFDRTLLVMNNDCLLEFDDNYCEIYHSGNDEAFIAEATALVYRFKEREKRQPLEINLVVQGHRGLELRTMEIKRTNLDIDLFYEDDFKSIDEVIRTRLRKKKDKGIVLLHGLPGTGKTTYLRYLVGRIRKRVLFLSPSVAGNLMNPEFIELLIDNPDTVVIIEDAESIVMDRKLNSSSCVSNLLNISDGLLADCLNVQLICTFNNALTMIDSALMRKGRLIARYEFGKLSKEKATKLSRHFGYETTVTEPMTIAEIANQGDKSYEAKKTEVIGFRRQEAMMN